MSSARLVDRVSTLVAMTFVVSACSATSTEAPSVSIAVAPLSLPGVERACYDLRVTNAAGGGGELVWARGTPNVSPDGEAICSDRFGQGGAITFVGPCDASGQLDADPAGERTNSVTLWVDALYDSDGPIAKNGANGWQDPCPNGCTLDLLCAENADTLASFDLTILRQANQGFFDVAVTFEDIFCSAKVDCRDDEGDPLKLLFHPTTQERDTTVVVGFACTAGPSDVTRTILYRDPLVVTCGGNAISLAPALDNGNAYSANNPDPNPNDAVWQYAVYAGDETLRCGAESCSKSYWNVAIGLDPTADNCTLTTRMTAAPEGAFAGLSTPAATTWPYIDVTVPLTNTSGLVCTRHEVNAVGSGVATAYTGFGATVSFASSYSSIAVNECARELDNCDTNATCTDTADGFACACLPGFTGNGVACADIDECALGTDNCHSDASCTNTTGGFTCGCLPGFSGDGTTCTDIDECQTGTDNCHENANCTNLTGTFACQCRPGFTGSGVSCSDIDECALGTDTCDTNADCTNTVGSFTCACLPGYVGDGFTCDDLAAPSFIVAAGLTDPIQIAAVTTLVDDLRDADLWRKLIAVYPMVGGSANAHKLNLIDPRDSDAAFRLTFSGTWTHSPTGAAPNGTNAWANTWLVPSSVFDDTTFESFGYYARTDSTPTTEWVMGSSSGTRNTSLWTRRSASGASASSTFSAASFSVASQASSTDGRGFYVATQQGTALKLFRAGTSIAQNTTAGSGTRSTRAVALGASNDNGTLTGFTSKECTFAFIGRSLTDTDVAALNLAVQRFQTTLARQIGAPSYTETVLNETPVTTSLLVHLDASKTASYPGTGTTWFDISGNNRHFTLFNGPTHVAGESFSFDGVNDYARTASTLNLSAYDYVAVDIVVKSNNGASAMAFEHTVDWNSNVGSFGLSIHSTGLATLLNQHHTNHSMGNTVRNYDAVVGTGWAQHVNLFGRVADTTGRLTWVNGQSVPFVGPSFPTTTSSSAIAAFANAHTFLASRGGTGSWLNGRISSFKIYGVKLNSSQVLKNFNAARVPVNL